MNTIAINRNGRIQHSTSEAESTEALDDLVIRLSRGDNLGVHVIAVTLRTKLIQEARIVLKEFGGEAEDVFNDLIVALLECRVSFMQGRDSPTDTLCGLIRMFAQQWREDRERDWGRDEEEG